MKEYDVAVIGLGIVGASAVYAAAWAGARVLALDAGVPGGGTSGASFAWLNAVRKEPEAYHRLNAAGMTAHVTAGPPSRRTDAMSGKPANNQPTPGNPSSAIGSS